MNIIKTLIMLPLFLIILLLAFVNNELVSLSLWPFDYEAEVSVSVIVVFFTFIGFFIGRVSGWFAASPLRKTISIHKKENKKLAKTQDKLSGEVGDLKSNIEVLKQNQKEEIVVKSRFRNIFKKKMV